jgi:hypothetical protein
MFEKPLNILSAIGPNTTEPMLSGLIELNIKYDMFEIPDKFKSGKDFIR